MEDDIHSRSYDLSKILTQLFSLDKECYYELWNFLFDWGNNLNLDVGRVSILKLSANLTDPTSLQLFADLEKDLKVLRSIMHDALMPRTHSDEDVQNTSDGPAHN